MVADGENETSQGVSEVQERSFKTPARDKIDHVIESKSALIIKLVDLKDSGLASKNIVSEIKEAREALKKAKQQKKRLASDAERQRKRRIKEKEIRMELAAESASNAKRLKQFTHQHAGRPPLENACPELHKALVEIAAAGAGADSRRRTDVLNACNTLDDLRAALLKEGFKLNRQAVYLRLIPTRSDSADGKLHVRTVPVKIRRARNSKRKKHQDADFCFATKTHLKNIATMFGSDSVLVISADDKAKVPLGITAATRQAPLVMHMEYEIRLPDHDFVVAPGHKLIPSVYAVCEIQSKTTRSQPEICHTGPMYIAIRSGKHDSSTAKTHGRDFDHLLTIPDIESIAKREGKVKPIVITFVDGGPDENPRFPKTLTVAIDHFKKHNLDVYIAMTHAPGMSAYNYVERRMAPHSKALAGVVLEHDKCGSHLDSSGTTTDDELEKKNFNNAGNALADIWRKLVLDEKPVFTEYVENQECSPDEYTERWISDHCRVSQYMFVIVKCDVQSCCGDMQTNWKSVFPDRFLPAPIPLRRTAHGPVVPEPKEIKKGDIFADLWTTISLQNLIKEDNQHIPYDKYCPSVYKDLKKRVCKGCNIYHPSMAAVNRHRKGDGCRGEHPVDGVEVDDEDDELVLKTMTAENASVAVAPLLSIENIVQNAPFYEAEGAESSDDEEYYV